MIKTAAAIFTGVLAGIITGLTPGLHINLVSSTVSANIELLSSIFSLTSIVAGIIAMSITHTFLDAIPATFLGAPDSDTALSILPAHELLLKGRGHEAVTLTLAGSLGSLLLSITFMPLALRIYPFVYSAVNNNIATILITVSALLILSEKKKIPAMLIFAISGTFGYFVLNSDIQNPLFPLLSGLFGISTLLISIKSKMKIPPQRINFNVKIWNFRWPVAISVLCGGVCSILPGIGASQAAVIGSMLQKKRGRKSFLVLTGGINTASMLLSLAAFYSLNKKRNGSIIAIAQILKGASASDFVMLVLSAVIAGSVSAIITLKISRLFVKIIRRVNYTAMCLSVIIAITGACILLSGIYGIVVLVTSTILGMSAPSQKVKRSNLMGSLIIPVIIYFIRL